MANKQTEYNRGRQQGLEMAYRILKDTKNEDGAYHIANEIRKRGRCPIKTVVTMKELEKLTEPIKWTIYESFMCMAIMVLHDQFGFGKKRCLDFINRWNFKTDCMSSGLVEWQDMVEAIKEEIGIDIPTECMKERGLIG